MKECVVSREKVEIIVGLICPLPLVWFVASHEVKGLDLACEANLDQMHNMEFADRCDLHVFVESRYPVVESVGADQGINGRNRLAVKFDHRYMRLELLGWLDENGAEKID